MIHISVEIQLFCVFAKTYRVVVHTIIILWVRTHTNKVTRFAVLTAAFFVFLTDVLVGLAGLSFNSQVSRNSMEYFRGLTKTYRVVIQTIIILWVCTHTNKIAGFAVLAATIFIFLADVMVGLAGLSCVS